MSQKKQKQENTIDPKIIEKSKENANPDCKKCYGRGYSGVNFDVGIVQTCKCVRANMRGAKK